MKRGLSEDLLLTARKRIRKAYEDVLEKKEDSTYSGLFSCKDAIELIIKEVYENYTAAFGMTVNQTGFRTAIAMYTENKTQSEGSRKIVIQLLFDILKAENLVKENSLDETTSFILESEQSLDNYEELFKEASIALKRAIRTYKIEKK